MPLFEYTISTDTKIQGEYIEDLVPIANLHKTVSVYISIKDGYHRVLRDRNYCSLTAVGQNCRVEAFNLKVPCRIVAPFQLD